MFKPRETENVQNLYESGLDLEIFGIFGSFGALFARHFHPKSFENLDKYVCYEAIFIVVDFCGRNTIVFLFPDHIPVWERNHTKPCFDNFPNLHLEIIISKCKYGILSKHGLV